MKQDRGAVITDIIIKISGKVININKDGNRRDINIGDMDIHNVNVIELIQIKKFEDSTDVYIPNMLNCTIILGVEINGITYRVSIDDIANPIKDWYTYANSEGLNAKDIERRIALIANVVAEDIKNSIQIFKDGKIIIMRIIQ